jgi:hypothetical protein
MARVAIHGQKHHGFQADVDRLAHSYVHDCLDVDALRKFASANAAKQLAQCLGGSDFDIFIAGAR